jgi:CxxC motif-containing protein (DUF1111 family)
VTPMPRFRSLLLAALLAAPLTNWVAGSPARLDAPYSGGDTTVVIPRQQLTDRGAFSFPADNLSFTRRGDHFAGNSFFQNPWVTAPASVASRDGLGPLFNTMSCQSCHVLDGRGRPPEDDEDMRSMLVRVSVPTDGSPAHAALIAEHGHVPHPVYGDQIQNNAIAGVAPEAEVLIEWEELPGSFADGQPYSLRRPAYRLEQPGYGAFGPDLLTSGRVAPQMIGIGLLDTIADATLLELADPDDADGDGISGRPNRVPDRATGERALGRFGWKGEQPNVRQQVASAFAGDIGITSSLFPAASHTAPQAIDRPSGGEPEVSDEILRLVTFYCKTLAVPAQRGHDAPGVLAGAELFRSAKCNACHVETLVTGEDPDFPELSGQTIHAYTDLLLHDLGPGLADDRPIFDASGSEWRTPPLWGLGLVFGVNRHNNFLHDGRARSFSEAILWHGGEAEASREAYRAMSADERRQLESFLKSL